MGKTLVGVPLAISAITANHEDAAYAAANLRTVQVRGGDRAHSATLNRWQLDADLGLIVPWNTLGLLYTNATELAGIRWRAAATQAGLDSAPVFDTYPFGVALRSFGVSGGGGASVEDVGNFFGLTSFSVSCRFRPNYRRREGLLTLADNAVSVAALLALRVGDGALRWYGNGLQGNLVGPVPSTTGFTRATGTYDSATQTMQLIVDGVLVATATSVAPWLVGPQKLFVANDDLDNVLDGEIDDIRVWNYARTAAEELADAGAELAGSPAGLVGYWKCNEGQGTAAANTVAGVSLTLGAGTHWCFPPQLWWSPDLHGLPWSHSYYVLPVGVGTARWIRCEVLDQGNPANYFAAGRLIVANAWITRKGRRYGDRFGSREAVDAVRLHGATVRRGSGVRATQGFTVVSDDVAELRKNCARIRAAAGASVPVTALHDFEDVSMRHWNSVYGTLAEEIEDVEIERGIGEASFEIEEM